MRRLFGVVAVALLLPAGLSAQKPGATGQVGARDCPACAPGEQLGRKVPVFITADQAKSAALARVKSDLAAGTLKAWGDEGGRTIRAAATLQVKADQVDDIHRLDGLYVVAVTSPNARGHVRVVVNRRTGAVVSSKLTSWDWGNSPDWWVKGLSSPPPAEKKGEDTLSVKVRKGAL